LEFYKSFWGIKVILFLLLFDLMLNTIGGILYYIKHSG
jgi:hypothetical protein